MTGLYECLVQIRALRETAQRLEPLVSLVDRGGDAPAATELMRERGRLERTHGEWLGLLLDVTAPVPVPGDFEPVDPLAAALDRFLAARDANLALLQRLGAAELERNRTLPDGRPTAVTDVVAMMIAADADAAAALRRLAPTPTDDPQGGP